MTNKEIRQMLNGVLGIQDFSRIDKSDVPKIIENIKNNLGVRNLGAELSELAKNNIDVIERSINPGAIFKIKPEEVRKITDSIHGVFGNITPDMLPPEDIQTQLKNLMAELSEGIDDEEGEGEKEDNTEE